MNVRKKLVSESKYGVKCPYTMTPKFIVVHNTANDASAENEISYMIGNNNEVSFHYAVDDKEVVQGIPTNRNAWHAGDGGSGNGNRNGIAIEICHSKSGGDRFTKSEQNAAKFIAQLLKEKGWGIDKVKKHQDFDGKYCPHRTLDMGWNRFLDMIQTEMEGSRPSTPKPQPKPKKIDVDHQAYANGKWWGNIRNYNNQNTNGYSGVIGYPILALQANTVGKASEVGYLEFRFHKLGDPASKWRFAWQRDRQKDKYGEYFAGDKKSKVDGLQMRLVNAPKGKKVRYRVHCIGKGWLGWITNYGSGNNGYAGWYGYAIDAVQIEVI